MPRKAQKTAGKPRSRQGSKRSSGPSPKFESQLRYLRGNKGIKTTEDGIPLMRECFYFALCAISQRLLQHLNGEKEITDFNLMGMFSQLTDKLRLFEGKSTNIEDHRHSLVEQIIMVIAEQKKANVNPRFNIEN